VLFDKIEKYIYILAWPALNRHYASCIGTLSFRTAFLNLIILPTYLLLSSELSVAKDPKYFLVSLVSFMRRFY